MAPIAARPAKTCAIYTVLFKVERIVGLNPIECAAVPEPDVTHDQNPQEHQHLDEAIQPQNLKLHGPGIQEHRFNVKDYKEDGDNIEAHRVPPAGVGFRGDAALVRHNL